MQPENFFVKERNTKLAKVGHTHTVRLQQDVPDHPEVNVKVLHSRYFVHVANAIVIFLVIS